MKDKKRSGKSPLFALCKNRLPMWQGFAVPLVFLAQLFVMYLIQNNFNTSNLKAAGLLLLALSLAVSGALISFLKSRKE